MLGGTLDVVGREEEIARIAGYVHLPNDGEPVAVVVDGDQGIGKTTVLRAAVSRARGRGHTVLSTSAAAAEAEVGFTGLGDLIGQVPYSFVAALPAPQRRAIDAALLTSDPDRAFERRALGAAVTRLLAGAALTAPLIIAIDDVHWIDEPSRWVLSFAARRLGRERIAWLTSHRTTLGRDEPPFGLGLTLPAERIENVRIGPLGLEALSHIVRDRTGMQLHRPDLIRLHAASGGNPSYAIQLAPTVAARLPGPLRLPAHLAATVEARLRGFDATTCDVLLAIALAPSSSIAVIEQTTGLPDAWPALRPALDGGIVEISTARVDFTHPLFAPSVIAQADPRRHAEMHRILAAHAETAEIRARHLAAVTEEADEHVAASVEGGARDALARGAPEIGAWLAGRSRELTASPGEVLWRRGLLEAECLYQAGDVERATALLERLASAAPHGEARARIMFRLALTPRGYRESVDLCEEALGDAADDPALASEIALTMGTSAFVIGDRTRAIEGARRAIALAESAGCASREWRARAAVASMVGAFGGGWDMRTIERAAEMEIASSDRPRPDGASLWWGQALGLNDRYADARAHLQRMHARAVEAGDASTAALFLGHLSDTEQRAGRFELARELALAAIDQFEQLGWDEQVGRQWQELAKVDAWLGTEDAARAAASRGAAIVRARGDNQGEVRHSVALAILEAGQEHWPALVDVCDEGLRMTATFVDPGVNPLRGFAAEAHAAIGDVDRAADLAAQLEAVLTEGAGPTAIMVARRCRGAAQAAAGDLEGAAASLRASLAAATEESAPHEVGQTLLLLGRVQRRAGHRSEAREALERAEARFAEAGAAPFAAQAAAELRRISGRRAHDPDHLTETERRVAELVAEGRSNKDVAAALFVSVKTVEATLTRVYETLGVHSRAELAARLAQVPKD